MHLSNVRIIKVSDIFHSVLSESDVSHIRMITILECVVRFLILRDQIKLRIALHVREAMRVRVATLSELET